MTQNLTKTNVEGYSKAENGAIVATNQQTLKAYKRQKQLFNSIDKIEVLELKMKEQQKEIDTLWKEIDKLKGKLNGRT